MNRSFYTGKILPYPKEVGYEDEVWELLDVMTGRAQAAILVGDEASSAEKLAAEELVSRVAYLSGGKTIPIASASNPPDRPAWISLGRPASNPLNRKYLTTWKLKIPDEPEGYVIAMRLAERERRGRLGGRKACVVAGQDSLGTYWGAQSLMQLLERRKTPGRDRVVLHGANVRDWPTYRLRSFKIGGAFAGKNSPDDMGRWAPSAKFNCYNICYTTLGQDKWKKPDPDFVAWVKDLTRYLRAREVDCMLFVNPYYLWKEHIETSNPADLEALAETCSLGLEAGATRVMLCLDDFASEPVKEGDRLYRVRSEKDRAAFGEDLGKVNVVMINDLYERLHKRNPTARLYVVPPYYWSPSGRYQAGGERDLKTLGAGVSQEVRLVWTGPQVRSAVITRAQTEYYQNLVQRKVMLWDNTLYMHHNPPHFFLDDFVTKYPDGFWQLASGEVHLNAGGGEAYKAGLLAAATLLWNPEKYEPAATLRDAVAVVAGPENVDALIQFRDAFYEVYDEYTQWLGTPQALIQRVKQLRSRPFDVDTVREVLGQLDKMEALQKKLETSCQNTDLMAEVAQLTARYTGYREAMALVESLPEPPEGEAKNLAPNPSAEEGQGDRVAQWQMYTGAGQGTLQRVEEGHSGKYAAKLTATRWHDWGDGRRSINIAAMVGPTNGFTGEGAPEVEPLSKYYVRLCLKGDAPRVVVSFTTWNEKGDRDSRGFARVKLQPIHPTKDWQECSASLVTPANAKRGALKIGIEGFEFEGGGLGSIFVDDVYVGRSKPAEGR